MVWDLLKQALGRKGGRTAGFRCFEGFIYLKAWKTALHHAWSQPCNELQKSCLAQVDTVVLHPSDVVQTLVLKHKLFTRIDTMACGWEMSHFPYVPPAHWIICILLFICCSGTRTAWMKVPSSKNLINHWQAVNWDQFYCHCCPDRFLGHLT